jgi:hypothetical protein
MGAASTVEKSDFGLMSGSNTTDIDVARTCANFWPLSRFPSLTDCSVQRRSIGGRQRTICI